MTLFDTKLVGYFITLSVKSIRSLKRYKAGKGQHILPAHAFSMHSGDAQLRSASITKRKWTACQVWIEGTDRNPLFSSKCSQFQLKVTPLRKANQLFFWGEVKSLAQKKDVVKISTRDSLHSSVPRPFISQAPNVMGKCSRPSLPSPANWWLLLPSHLLLHSHALHESYWHSLKVWGGYEKEKMGHNYIKWGTALTRWIKKPHTPTKKNNQPRFLPLITKETMGDVIEL